MKRKKVWNSKNCHDTKHKDGSITLFLSLVLMLIFSFFFSLLEAGRVSCLSQIARRNLMLGLESVFGEYDQELWEHYRLLFLDGSSGTQALDLALLEGHMLEEDSLRQKGTGFFQMALKDLEITEYSLATDEAGAAFEKQACQAIQEQLAAGAVDALKQNLQKGEEMAKEGQELEEKWDSAKDAMTEAEKIEKEGQPKGEEQEKSDPVQADGAEQEKGDPAQADKKDLPENPVDSVDLLKKSAILALVVENPNEISGKTIALQDTISKRVLETGNRKAPKIGVLDKFWFLQYLNHYFACKTGAGEEGSSEHALEYELEYCVAGRESDQENLEKTVKELLLIREAGNFVTIMQDGQKQALALEIASAAVGFTGIPPLIQAVKIGILLAWSYIESILDVRSLLSGGKVALIKKVSDWKSDVSLGQEALREKTGQEESEDGLSYREYLQILLLLVRENTLVCRAMDVVEQNVRLKQEHFRMDHQLYAVQAEGLYGAEPLFLGFVTGGKLQEGLYHFRESRECSYES